MTGKAKNVGRYKRYAAVRLYLHELNCQDCDPVRAVGHARLWHAAARDLVLAYVPDDPDVGQWLSACHEHLCPTAATSCVDEVTVEAVFMHVHEFMESAAVVVRELRKRIEAAA